MKKLEFTTSKGSFISVDADSDGRVKLPTNIEYQEIGRIKNMTEEQFAEVVDSSIHTGLFAHYVKDIPVNTYCYNSAKESFESLVKSLGWYLWENPYQEYHLSTWHDVDKEKQEAESKTLYSPILLKKI